MKRKITALALAACMSAGLLAGCSNDEPVESGKSTAASSQSVQDAGEQESTQGQPESEEADLSEHVVLTIYCIGDEGGVYADQHIEELNKLLTEKINVSIEPLMVSWGEYNQKLPMVWASGEEYDLTYTADWCKYFQEASRGAFMDITELFPKYAPKTYAEMKESGTIDGVLIDGRQYMIPAEVNDWTSFVYTYREDLRKKYNCPEIVDLDTLQTFFDAITENEPEMMAMANSGNDSNLYHLYLNEVDWARPVDVKEGVLTYDLRNATEVFNVVDTPEYEEFVNRMRSWYEKGYWSKSVMAETLDGKEMFDAGKAACTYANVGDAEKRKQNAMMDHPDWEVKSLSLDLLSGLVEKMPPSGNGMAVGAYSKNPERALMFMELLYQDMEVYHMFYYGIEGVTYEKDLETMTKWVPEGIDSSSIALKNLGMGFCKVDFILNSKTQSEEDKQRREDYSKVSVFPALGAFSIDQTNISAELAALASVYAEYKVPLDKGVVDPSEGLSTLRKKLKEAGIDKVMEEVNKQIAEYIAE